MYFLNPLLPLLDYVSNAAIEDPNVTMKVNFARLNERKHSDSAILHLEYFEFHLNYEFICLCKIEVN